jgi:hypothetical protein
MSYVAPVKAVLLMMWTARAATFGRAHDTTDRECRPEFLPA